MLQHALLTIIFLFSPLVVGAKINFSFVDTYVGASNFNRFAGTYQTDEQGTLNKYEFNPAIIAGLQFDYQKNFSQFFEGGVVIPEEGRDPHISKLIYFFMTNFGYSIRDYTIKVGAGLVMTRISSDGGTETLNNGTGYTNFPLPPESRTARNMIANLELEYFFLADWSVRASYQIYNLSDSETREYGNMITFVYHFWEKDWRLWHKK